jgi:hypothetical protein
MICAFLVVLGNQLRERDPQVRPLLQFPCHSGLIAVQGHDRGHAHGPQEVVVPDLRRALRTSTATTSLTLSS